MTRSRITAALAALTATAALAAGCGSDSSGGDSGGSGGSATATKTGGTLTGNFTSFPDYLDPALSYTQEGWIALWVTYTPLLTYKHADGAEGATVVPGLAEDMPTISSDKLTYTFKLRPDLKYSDGTAVKASDFQRTIQRVLNQSSGGSSFYMGIKGAEDYVKAGKATAPIPGIKTDDSTGTIQVTLEKPDAQFEYKIAMDFAGLVKGDTPFTNQTKTPPPGVGAFKIEDVTSGQKFSLVKNPYFKGLPNTPVAKVDRIDMSVVKNQRRQAQDIINNKVDWLDDAAGPDVTQALRNGAKGRYKEFVTNSMYYYFLNSKIPPFDNIKARQAVAYAIDKRAIARLYGGLLSPTCNFLPPGMIGYKKIDPCPYGDPNAAPNVAKAKQLVQESGTAGTSIQVWGDDEDPSTPVVNYLSDVLNSIGYKAKPKILDGADYFQAIGNQASKAQAGFDDWFQDFPHPANFLFLVDGATIQKTGNQNHGNTDDPALDAAIAKANSIEDPKEAVDQYAAIDKTIVENAYAVPYGNRKLALTTSSRVAFDSITWSPLYYTDLSTIALKAE